MKRWHFIIDVAKCHDCNDCMLSCKDEHLDNPWPGYSAPQPRHGHRWIDLARKERGQFPQVEVACRPTPCLHCDHAPCIQASGGAAYQRPDGIVLFDPDKARGRKDLVESCPYGLIGWNEEFQVPQKCTFCAHLLDQQGWTRPRCVQACATGALTVQYVEDSEMEQMIRTDQLETLHPEYGTRPTAYYKNLYCFASCFIAGSVAVQNQGVLDCAEGARVVLRQNGEVLAVASTDNYGDFKFDRLPEDSGKYQVEISLAGHKKSSVEVDLRTSVSLGTICL